MSFNAWMPLQGTKTQTAGKSYQYSAAKNKARSKTTAKTADDSFWKLAAESYEPSVAAKEYQAGRTSAKKADAFGDVELSADAKKLLKQLKEKYGNMDFFVASYSSDEEAQAYLGRGTKEYSVLIDPETLEKMASDADVRKQYEDVLSGAGDKLAQLKEELGEDADQVKSFGISIDNTGSVSYFAELDKITESRQNQVERAKEKRAEDKAKAAKKAKKDEMKERTEGRKSETKQFVKADTIEGLIEKIRNAVDGGSKVAKEGFDLTM